MAASTRVRVGSDTRSGRLSTLETVPSETPAVAATSLTLTGREDGLAPLMPTSRRPLFETFWSRRRLPSLGCARLALHKFWAPLRQLFDISAQSLLTLCRSSHSIWDQDFETFQ